MQLKRNQTQAIGYITLAFARVLFAFCLRFAHVGLRFACVGSRWVTLGENTRSTHSVIRPLKCKLSYNIDICESIAFSVRGSGNENIKYSTCIFSTKISHLRIDTRG